MAGVETITAANSHAVLCEEIARLRGVLRYLEHRVAHEARMARQRGELHAAVALDWVAAECKLERRA